MRKGRHYSNLIKRISQLSIPSYLTFVLAAGSSNAAGKIWISKNSGLDGGEIRALANDPLTPQVIYAGTDEGIFKLMPHLPLDADADGRSDITVWRRNDGVWYSLQRNSPGSYMATRWGLSADTPASGDYDGDGKTNIAVFRASNGTWYIRLSGSPGSYTATRWGMESDVAISPLTGILSSIP